VWRFPKKFPQKGKGAFNETALKKKRGSRVKGRSLEGSPKDLRSKWLTLEKGKRNLARERGTTPHTRGGRDHPFAKKKKRRGITRGVRVKREIGWGHRSRRQRGPSGRGGGYKKEKEGDEACSKQRQGGTNLRRLSKHLELEIVRLKRGGGRNTLEVATGDP